MSDKRLHRTASTGFKRVYDGTEPGPLAIKQDAEKRALLERAAQLRALRRAKEEAEKAAKPKPRIR